MASDMPTCKITVLKRTLSQDLIDEYLDEMYQDMDLANVLQKAKTFSSIRPSCPRNFVRVALGPG